MGNLKTTYHRKYKPRGKMARYCIKPCFYAKLIPVICQIYFPVAHIKEAETMLWTIFVILLILWILGFSFKIGGGLIHLLLVIAVIVLIIRLVTGRTP